MSGMFPFTAANLFGGAIRVLYAPTSVAVPTDITDIIDVESPYAAQTGWVDVGATGGPATYSKAIAKAGYGIQQSSSVVLEEVSETTRSFGFQLAEFTPALMNILEESTGTDAVAGASGVSAQQRVPFGTITSLTSYRWAFIGRRKKSQGLVTESVGSITRGGLVAWVAYKAEIAGDTSQISIGEGDMATIPVTVTCYPESTITAEGEEHGFFISETLGQTIAA